MNAENHAQNCAVNHSPDKEVRFYASFRSELFTFEYRTDVWSRWDLGGTGALHWKFGLYICLLNFCMENSYDLWRWWHQSWTLLPTFYSLLAKVLNLNIRSSKHLTTCLINHVLKLTVFILYRCGIVVYEWMKEAEIETGIEAQNS